MTPEITNRILAGAISNEVFRAAVQSAFNHIIITDTDGIIIYANSAVERITGYTNAEVMGQTPRLWGQQMGREVYVKMWHTLKEERVPYRSDLINKRKNGELYHTRAVISPIIDHAGILLGFIGTEEDITKEKEVDRMKTEFISITAHQLLTPLTGMKWGLQSLQKRVGLTGSAADTLQQVSESNERMISLVTALLNITRLESGRLSVQPTPIDMAQLIGDITASMEGARADRRQTLTQNIADNLPRLSADAQLVWEVLKNLLSNSIKYTPDDGSIGIAASMEGQAIVVSVTDSGIGIAQEDQRKLFRKFFRADNAKDLTPDGTGLGLYFVKMIVDSFGGLISCESVLGKGSTFRVFFPLQGMQPRAGDVHLSGYAEVKNA